MPTTRGRNSALYQRMRTAFRRQCKHEDARCWLCWQPIDYALPAEDLHSFSLDHFHPVSTHPELAEEYINFRPSHLSCNTRRGNRPPPLDLGITSREW